MKKTKSKKLKKLSQLHKDTWDVFSKFIRQRDEGICYTCGDTRSWKEQQAGHFKHKNCLDFDEINIHCQCVKCNKWLHGNLGEYAVRLIKEYGQETIDDLIFRSNQVRKITREELENIKDKYSVK